MPAILSFLARAICKVVVKEVIYTPRHGVTVWRLFCYLLKMAVALFGGLDQPHTEKENGSCPRSPNLAHSLIFEVVLLLLSLRLR